MFIVYSIIVIIAHLLPSPLFCFPGSCILISSLLSSLAFVCLIKTAVSLSLEIKSPLFLGRHKLCFHIKQQAIRLKILSLLLGHKPKITIRKQDAMTLLICSHWSSFCSWLQTFYDTFLFFTVVFACSNCFHINYRWYRLTLDRCLNE